MSVNKPIWLNHREKKTVAAEPVTHHQISSSDHYNRAAVFRRFFLYYISHLCTNKGARITAEHFARLQVALAIGWG